jgi:hypothetical protein
MRRTLAFASMLGAIVGLAIFTGTARADSDEYGNTTCQMRAFLCIDPYHSIGYDGAYTGHDEPSLLFTSHRPGTGNDLTYKLQLPREATVPPNQANTGGTWNFMRRATFWFGLSMCDTQSSPNFRHTCKADSDANARYRSFNPHSPFYIGKAPGNAYLELQFYEPGWVSQWNGFGCGATTYCAAMTIDSLSDQDNTGVQQNASCLNLAPIGGEEPINWAYITKSGKSQAPANPLAVSKDPNLTALFPDYKKDLLMHPGDWLVIHMHDTPAGFRVDIFDKTTHQHGSMTASVANGFGHLLFQPKATTCHERPYAFHPEFSSAVKRGSTWGAHTYNVAFSDEIGHFEFCNAIDPNTAACTQPGDGDNSLDEDDQGCLPASLSSLFPISGCTLDDGDFDSPSYRNDWPGSWKNHHADRRWHGAPVRFTSPTTNGRTLEHAAFEVDLPRIERGEPGNAQPECDGATGAHCHNPPIGAQFYPIYTTSRASGSCIWQFGGVHLPNTTRTFGGNSTVEYGHILRVGYADVGFKPIFLYEDYHRDLRGNPCPA